MDDGYGTEDEEPPDELAQLRKEKAVLEKRLERARREVTLGNTTKQPSRVLNVSYRRHDGNAPSESDAHIPSAGPLFGRKLPQQRALPLRPQNRTGVAADGKRSPARRRARRRGTGQGGHASRRHCHWPLAIHMIRVESPGEKADHGRRWPGASEEQENKSIEERLLSPIAGLLAQLHSGALDPLQLSPEWRPPLIAYLRHILGDEWRCRSDAASFRLGPFKETADDVLQKLGAAGASTERGDLTQDISPRPDTRACPLLSIPPRARVVSCGCAQAGGWVSRRAQPTGTRSGGGLRSRQQENPPLTSSCRPGGSCRRQPCRRASCGSCCTKNGTGWCSPGSVSPQRLYFLCASIQITILPIVTVR